MTHYARYRGHRIAVVTQLDANGGYFAVSVSVRKTTGSGVVEDAVPYEVLAFENEALAIREAIALAEAFIDKRITG